MRDIGKKLDKTLTKVVTSLHKKRYPIADGSNYIFGDEYIKKENGLYVIYNRITGKLLYTDIFLIESALLIANYMYDSNDKLKEVLTLDNRYAKYYLDMKSYLNTIRSCNECGKYTEAQIAEDRYAISKNDVRCSRIKIQRMCDKIIRNR